MVTTKAITQLMAQTKRIISHQKEKEILKGERFNVFSILRMESNENGTHSAFLCELLKPDGSHLKGNVFLRLFLETIGHTASMDINTSRATTEKHIGARDEVTETGGRIDIYIRDAANNTICIENKIYAHDQAKQIVRYCNYNLGKNTVYYLSLLGSEPGEASKGSLKAGENYHITSHKDEIIGWLKLCIKEAADAPILRETIRQYIILLQKLTATMDVTEENELIEVMLGHYEEASYIAANFAKVKLAIGEKIRQAVIQGLSMERPDEYVVVPGQRADRVNSQIWVKLKGFEEATLYFGIQSFSGETLFIGILNEGGDPEYYVGYPNHEAYSPWWINVEEITDFSGYAMNLSDASTAIKIHTDEVFKERFVRHIVTEMDGYIQKSKTTYTEFLDKQK